MDIKASLQNLANKRNELGELVLDDTIQSYQRIENIIVRRGQINLKYELRLSELKLVKARETGGSVSGKTAHEWEAHIEYLLESDEETGGLSNEDLDRLLTVRDKISKLLGVEPPKKLAVEHTFVMQAKDAQQRLRDRLGLSTLHIVNSDGSMVMGPGAENSLPDGEIIEALVVSEDEANPIRS
jgi:hypothetical protein